MSAWSFPRGWGAILRLDAANTRDDVRSKTLGRPACKTFRTMGGDIFRCRIEAAAIGPRGTLGQKPDQMS